MKLLVDENLPPRLASDLADLFPDSSHVSLAGLGGAPDAVLWEFAKAHDFTFITKDKDFAHLSLAWGAPPRVIVLQTGNCSTAALIHLIRNNAARLTDFDENANRSLLILR